MLHAPTAATHQSDRPRRADVDAHEQTTTPAVPTRAGAPSAGGQAGQAWQSAMQAQRVYGNRALLRSLTARPGPVAVRQPSAAVIQRDAGCG